MGTSNYLHIEADGRKVMIQYKYAYRREIEYVLGDTVDWAGKPRPDHAAGEVVVHGLGLASERRAQRWDRYYAILIHDDVLATAVEITGSEMDALEEAEADTAKALGVGHSGVPASEAPQSVRQALGLA